MGMGIASTRKAGPNGELACASSTAPNAHAHSRAQKHAHKHAPP